MEQRKQTAVTALFAELKSLAEGMRFSQDNESANLIDYICTREPIVLQWEKEQIKATAIKCHFEGVRQSAKTSEEYITYSEEYYNETYKKDAIPKS